MVIRVAFLACRSAPPHLIKRWAKAISIQLAAPYARPARNA
jgi:hypothetical protein